MKGKPNLYAVYKGDECLAVGTIHEIEEQLGIKDRNSIYKLASPSYLKGMESRKHNRGNYRILIKLDEEDEDE